MINDISHIDNQAGHNQDWTMEIKPNASLFKIDFKEIWRYRDLLILFVKRDFAAQYKQTILGPIWHVIQPVFTTLVFLFVFGSVANIPTDGVEPKILFYMSGITLWNYFSACLINSSSVFVTNASIFGKVYFPRLIMPLSIVLSNIFRFGIQFLLLLAMFLFYKFKGYPLEIGFNWIFIPVLVLLMAGIGLGAGIIFSSLTTKYRDLSILLSFGVQLMMYATPIAYPLSFVANTKYEWVLKLNPLSGITEAFRHILFNTSNFDSSTLIYSSSFMIVILIIGVLLFNKVEKTFMDTV